MTITIGIHHEYTGYPLVEFDTETLEFDFDMNLEMFDERRNNFTWFRFDPFTGKKINKKYLK